MIVNSQVAQRMEFKGRGVCSVLCVLLLPTSVRYLLVRVVGSSITISLSRYVAAARNKIFTLKELKQTFFPCLLSLSSSLQTEVGGSLVLSILQGLF